METGAAAVGLVAGIASVITIVSKTIVSLNTARLKFSEADLSVELLAGQLYTVRTALNQVQAFIQESSVNNEQHEDFATDLCLAIEHCEHLVQHIHNQISRLEWLPGEPLQARGKARLLLEERILRDNMILLNNQISALNLCLTAFKCRPSSPSKEPPERDLLQYQPQLPADDTASGQLAADLMSFPPPSELRPVSRSGSRVSFIKRFDLDRLSLKASFYERGFRSLSRANSLDTRQSEELSPTTVRSSMLKLSNSLAQSARVDSLIKRDADQRWRNIKLLAVGQRSTTTVKRLRYAIASPPSPEEVENCRRVVVSSAVKALLALAEHVGNTIALFEMLKRQGDIQALELFLEHGGPAWEVTPKISKAAMSLWLSPRMQQCYKARAQSSSYFLRATERLLQPDYEPTLTDIIKTDAGSTAVAMEAKLTVEDVLVNVIDAPQPKLSRLIRHFEDADAYLLSLDLSSYDRYEDGNATNLLEFSIQSIQRRWKINKHVKPVLLVMYNAAEFRRKLTKTPLSTHFSEYRGAKDFNSAKDFLLQRCRTALHTEQPLFHHFSDDDADDTAIVDFFKETVLQLPHLIVCVKNLEQFLGSWPKPSAQTYRRKRTPSVHLRASF